MSKIEARFYGTQGQEIKRSKWFEDEMGVSDMKSAVAPKGVRK